MLLGKVYLLYFFDVFTLLIHDDSDYRSQDEALIYPDNLPYLVGGKLYPAPFRKKTEFFQEDFGDSGFKEDEAEKDSQEGFARH